MNLARWRMLILAVPLLAVAGTLGACGYFASTDDRISDIEKLLSEGRYGEAAIEARTALDKAPDDGRVHLLLVRTALALGSLDAAEKAIADAAATGADAQALGDLRAQMLFDGGKPRELLAALDEAKLDLGDDRRDAWRVLAWGALGRCEELIPPARQRLLRQPAESATRVAISDCYARAGNRDRALAEVDAGLEVKPDDARLLMARARLLVQMNRRPEAESAWKKASDAAAGQLNVPEQVLLQLTLSEIHVLHEDLAGLRASHQKLLELAPQGPATRMIGARVQMMQGEIVDALNALRALAAADTEPPPVHVLLASSYIAQRSLEQARLELAWLQRNAPGLPLLDPLRGQLDGLARAPADSEEYFLRAAAVQATLGQMDLARAEIAKAQDKAPQSIRPAVLRVQLELRAGNPAGALGLAEALAAQHPANGDVMLTLAETLRANARYEDASRRFADLYARAPSAGMAMTLHRVRVTGGLPDTTAPLTDWLAKQPGDVTIRGAYADALRIAGDNRGAITEYLKVTELAPQNAVALNNLAWILYLERDPRAVATARRAWKLAPDIPVVADTLGWILVETNQVAEGLPLLEQADRAIGLAQPDVRYHHAAALARAGRRDQARAILEAFLPEWQGDAIHAEASGLLATLAGSGGP